MARAFIGIGSNIDPETNVFCAVRLLRRETGIARVSMFYRTLPEGRPEQPPFYNGVVEIETDIPPEKLKHSVLRKIEAELGRVRRHDKYAPRTIDLDVLIYDDLVLDTDGLRLPDPQIRERAFLAVPLCELSPELVVPGSGERVCKIAESLNGDGMTALPDFTQRLREEARGGR